MKKLSDLFDIKSNLKIDILYDDSRLKVKNGLFFAIKGVTVDGHDYIEAAIKNGAIAVVAEKNINVNVPVIVVKDTNVAYNIALNKFYDNVLDKLKSNLYGKVINLGSTNALVNKPDYSYIPLKNYQIDYITGEKYGYENAINTTEIMIIKKQLALGEVAFLTNVFSKLEENQLNFL